jgi:hypothetical protein
VLWKERAIPVKHMGNKDTTMGPYLRSRNRTINTSYNLASPPLVQMDDGFSLFLRRASRLQPRMRLRKAGPSRERLPVVPTAASNLATSRSGDGRRKSAHTSLRERISRFSDFRFPYDELRGLTTPIRSSLSTGKAAPHNAKCNLFRVEGTALKRSPMDRNSSPG